jgi:preprotein translocase subunit SecF
MTYQDSANLAMNQVFARSLNTSLTTLIPVAALLIVGAGLAGAETLEDLALALFVGILAGTYSSIFIATPVLSMLKEHEPKYKNTREKILRDAKKKSATPKVVAPAGPASDEVTAAAPVTVSSARSSAPKRPSGSRPRAGSKKSARRKRR